LISLYAAAQDSQGTVTVSGSSANTDLRCESPLLASARTGDADAFQNLAEPYRRELQLHCYRMLGSVQDAEDLVQETFVRAWRSINRFEGRSSFRSWLYRIATNACLNALASRTTARRLTPQAVGPPSSDPPDGTRGREIRWLEPYPDSALEGIPDAAPGPEARYELHEAVQLAFVAAIQHLPPRQRAVLLLRDVLGWPASDTARLLESSVASANSALQRARATLHIQFPGGRPAVRPEPDGPQRALVERYASTWERHDLDGFVALLRDDAVLSMPPLPQWYLGRAAIRDVFARVWIDVQFRVVHTAANRQPAFAMYGRNRESADWHAHAIQLLTVQDDAIAVVTTFLDTRLFTAFGLPAVLPEQGAVPPTSGG
jgi:RNA polymerase sigma-70 factor, ECF subfamily